MDVFEELRDHLNRNARNLYHRKYEPENPFCRADRDCRLSWPAIQKCAKRLGLDVYLAVPGDVWDKIGGGYWRVILVSTDYAQDNPQGVLIEDQDSPHLVNNFKLFKRYRAA